MGIAVFRFAFVLIIYFIGRGCEMRFFKFVVLLGGFLVFSFFSGVVLGRGVF